LRAELERMVAECRGGRVAECRVIEVLADHELCRFHGRHREASSVPGAG